MLHKANSTGSYSDIIQQGKIWASMMTVSRKALAKNSKIQRMVYDSYKVHSIKW